MSYNLAAAGSSVNDVSDQSDASSMAKRSRRGHVTALLAINAEYRFRIDQLQAGIANLSAEVQSAERNRAIAETRRVELEKYVARMREENARLEEEVFRLHDEQVNERASVRAGYIDCPQCDGGREPIGDRVNCETCHGEGRVRAATPGSL